MNDTETPWFSTREAVARLGIPPRELYRLIDAGELPAYKHGRDIRLRQADVDAYRAGHSS